MKRTAYRLLSRLGEAMRNSRLSNLPIVKRSFRAVKRNLDPEYVVYEGYRLHIPSHETVAQRISSDGSHEKEVRDSIHQNLTVGDVAVDLGAHYGNHTLSMATAVGPGGCVIAFEPHPDTIEYLTRTIKENSLGQIELVNKAASNERSTVNMAASGSSTFRSRELAGEMEFETTVETTKLSEYLDRNSIEAVDLIKIDIEGAEAEVLDDLGADLGRFNCIILELHDQILTDAELQEIFERLSGSGDVESVSGESITSVEEMAESDDLLIWTAN